MRGDGGRKMNIKLTSHTEKVIRTHIAEYEGIEVDEVEESMIAKLINQMIHRAGRECNLAEDYLE